MSYAYDKVVLLTRTYSAYGKISRMQKFEPDTYKTLINLKNLINF